jgi:hypothetical protein
MSQRTPTLAGVINIATERLADRLCVAVPARVESYDPTTQRINAQPLIKRRYEDEEGDLVVERMPVVTNVPVEFPGAGPWGMTFPIAVGDTVLLVFADRSLDVWLSEGGEVDPLDTRKHHMSDAVAIPGLRSFKTPLSGVSSTYMVLGKPGATVDAVALAAKVLTELQALRTTLNGVVNSFNAHGHVTTCGSGAGTAAPPVVPAALPAAVNSVASTTVKVSE